MMKLLRGFGPAMLGLVALSASAAAQGYPGQQPAAGQSSNPACMRLEAQLASINRGQGDTTRADQIKRYEDAAAKQQAELDRAVAQSRKQGCEGLGFFSLFTGQGPQCSPLTTRIQQMRGNLDQVLSDLEKLKSNNDQNGQRSAILGQLAQNDCGPQYRNASTGPGGFFGALFGSIVNPGGGDGAPSGTYRTVCVRTCDGYYFPISYSTVPGRFADDQKSCQRQCPSSEAVLYSYRNPGEDMEQAVSINGQPYTALPTAFHYRKEITAACSCRRPGQSWADALKNADDSSTLERGDIVVTQDKAKLLSQAPRVSGQGKPAKPGAATPANATTAAAQSGDSAAETDPAKRKVRAVGPTYLPER